MNEELRRSLDRAAGADPQLDLTESVWADGRAVRRRRHAAQAVGGTLAAAVVAGAFALGGGVLSEPNAFDGPARPTVDDTAHLTAATVTPTTGPEAESSVPEPPTAEPTATQAEPAGHEADGTLVLTTDSIDGVPMDGPAADLVAALTAELGDPSLTMPGTAVTSCNDDGSRADVHVWDAVELVSAESGVSWTVHAGDLPVNLDLPGSLELGMTEEALRATETVVAEHRTGGGRPVLVLGTGVAVGLGEAGLVTQVDSSYTPPC